MDLVAQVRLTIEEHHLLPRRGRTIQHIWERAGTLQVLRRDPLATATGKVLHLHRERGALLAASGDGAEGGTEE